MTDLAFTPAAELARLIARRALKASTTARRTCRRRCSRAFRIYREIQGWFQHYDMIATPTLARTALAIDHDFFAPIEIDGEPTDTVRKARYPYTHSFNLSGNPAVTLPCGWADGGLPVGPQLVGPYLSDARLLRAAALFEVSVPWIGRTPPLSW